MITRTGVLEPHGLGTRVDLRWCVRDRRRSCAGARPAASGAVGIAPLRNCVLRCRALERRTIRWTSPAARCCSPTCSSRACASWAGSRNSLRSPACSTCRSRRRQATEFVLAALRHIAAGLRASTVPALMISHSVKPVTEISMRIIEEIGLPYVSAGIHHGMNAFGRAFWWSEQYRRLATAPAPAIGDCAGGRAPAIRARHARVPGPAQCSRGSDDTGHGRGSGDRGGTCDRRARGVEARFRRRRAQE